MTPAEAKFRDVEKQLDCAMQSAAPTLQQLNISFRDTSVRSYYYKESYLSWSYLFKRVWELDLETAQVQIHLSFGEPIEISAQREISIWLRAEKFRQGQESSFNEKTESTVSLSTILEHGVENIVVEQVKAGAQLVGQAL